MKTIKDICTALLLLTTVTAWGQNRHITPPYYCGFEDATENALWELNIGSGTQCNDLWYIGTAAFNEGSHSLYISDNGGLDAQYGAKPNVTVVKRTFTIPDGGYEVSFDWRNLAQNNSGLYVCIYQQGSITADSDPNTSAIPQWVQRTWRPVSMSDGSSTTCMSGTSEWMNSSFTFNVAGNRTMEIAFVWVNSNRDTTVLNPVSACIDNIQITSTNCRKPWDMTVDATCDTVWLSWQGVSEQYTLEYKPNGEATWRTIDNIKGRSYMLTGIGEGVYDFRVRGMCTNPTSGETTYSAYATKSAQLVFCPDNHCINYVDLTAPGITCYTGIAGNPASFVQNLVNYGPNEPLSRHTVNWNRNQYDPRTGSRLKTVPDGEYASIRLGNWRLGGEAERIDFSFTVDAQSAAILLMKYAIVFEDPDGHPETDKPYFTLTILDENGIQIDPSCGFIQFYADRTRPGWYTAGSGSGSVVMWKDWTTIGINLAPYDGQTLTIRLETGDCTWQGHYGYAYFTLSCTSGKIQNVSCGASPTMDIEAPEGFDYEWYSSMSPDTPLGTEQVYTVDASDTTTYYCKCMLKENHECYFTLSTVVSPREAYAEYAYEWQPSNCQNIVRFRNLSHVTSLDENDSIVHTDEPCETTTWYFGKNDRRVENDPVYIFPPEGGTLNFSMKAEISNGECSDSISGTVTVPSITSTSDTIVETICNGDFRQFAGTTYFRSDTVTDSALNVAGCDSVTTLFLTVLPKIEDTPLTDTICFGDTLWVGQHAFTEAQTDRAVRLYTENGCDSVVVLNLTVLDEVTFDVTTTPEREEPLSGTISIENAPEGYTYSIDGEMGGKLTGLAGGTYKIVVYNSYGCASDTVEAFVDRECLEIGMDSAAYVTACADDSVAAVPFSLGQGFLSDYVVRYGQKAISAGFEDDSTQVEAETYVNLHLPDSCRPDIYDAVIVFKDVICEDLAFPVTIEVDYARSIVVQKWNNVLAVKNSTYNGGYDFAAFQWYRNGTPLPGETGSYLYLGEGAAFDTTDTYHAVLTRRDDGVTMPTCPAEITVHEDVSEYPMQTVVQAGAPLRIAGVEGEATARLYNAAGALCLTAEIDGHAPEIVMPSAAGIYILYIDSSDGGKHYKIVVR